MLFGLSMVNELGLATLLLVFSCELQLRTLFRDCRITPTTQKAS